jgi:hypothetical protein
MDFKMKFLQKFKKTRNVFAGSKKAKELNASIIATEEEMTRLVKFMKSITLRNRKMMVDLNLKLAVAKQSKKRESAIFKVPANF